MGARRIDRFQVEREAGRGGMGIVYRAIDAESGAPVALKVLSQADATDAAVERFEREAVALAALDHPAIVRYLGHGRTEGGEIYLAMSWLEGEDLAARLRRGPLTVAETIGLCRTLTAALANVHARGLVHRDLKPSNIWLADGDVRRPILIDFGIARNSAVSRMTNTGSTLGTPQYMAPEQIRGKAEIDGRSDLFSLGAILYECITGRPAFVGGTVMAVLAKVLLDESAPLAVDDQRVPRSLIELQRQLVAKSPDERPVSARDVGVALARCAAELGDDVAPGLSVDVERGDSLSLTARERRLVAVVLVDERRATAGLAETMAASPAIADTGTDERRLKLVPAARSHGGELVPLGAHRFLVSFAGGGEAIDQAASAARCALALAAAWPDAVVALGLGRSPVGQVSLGEVIDRAAALLHVEGDARVRADATTAALLEVRFQVEPCGTFASIVMEREPEERPRTLLGKPTRFVGRTRELGAVQTTLDEVVEESVARALLVTGVPGVGKSRLRYEITSRMKDRARPVQVLLARAEPLRAGSPLDLCAALVRAWAGIHGSDEDAARRALVARVASRCGAESGDIAEFLGEIIGARFSAEPGTRVALARKDARVMSEHLVRAFIAMLRAECAIHPTVVIVEDLHWGDPQTVRFLDAALKELTESPLLVVAFARPEVYERFPGLWRTRGVTELALHPLSTRVCTELAREVLGAVEPATLERVVRYADGNALYLEELIRAAAAGELSQLPVPMVAMVQARLEAQEPDERHVLRAASILGERVDAGAVRALLGTAVENVDALLSRLVEAELMVRADDLTGFTFRHAAVREAAYAMLTDNDRRIGHALAGRWLEEHGERDTQLLAEHYDRAGDVANAARCYARSARQAVDRLDADAALERGARAIELDPSPSIIAEARLARGEAFHCQGRLLDASNELTAALAALPEGDDERRLDFLRAVWDNGVYRQSSAIIRQVADDALRIAKSFGRDDLLAEAQCALAVADHCDERCDEGRERLRAAFALTGKRSNPAIFNIASILLYHGGAFEEGEQTTRDVLAFARELHDHTNVAVLLANLGMHLSALGRYEEGRECFTEAESVSERYGLPMMLARTMSISVGPLLAVLDLEAAEHRAAATHELGAKLEFSTPRVSALIDLGFIASRRGDPQSARWVADSVAKDLETGSGFHGWLWRSRVQVLRTEIAYLDGEYAQAVSLADRAIETNARLRRRKYVAAAEIVRARALWKLARRDEALVDVSKMAESYSTFSDPAVRLRVAMAFHELGGEARARDLTLDAATVMESGLPVDARAAFRRAVDLGLASRLA